jgi:hypothetical protein
MAQEYTKLVCREIEATDRFGSEPLETVFFGGGTPSLVPPELIQRILDALQVKYGIVSSAEISMEADPGAHSGNTGVPWSPLSAPHWRHSAANVCCTIYQRSQLVCLNGASWVYSHGCRALCVSGALCRAV